MSWPRSHTIMIVCFENRTKWSRDSPYYNREASERQHEYVENFQIPSTLACFSEGGQLCTAARLQRFIKAPASHSSAHGWGEWLSHHCVDPVYLRVFLEYSICILSVYGLTANITDLATSVCKRASTVWTNRSVEFKISAIWLDGTVLALATRTKMQYLCWNDCATEWDGSCYVKVWDLALALAMSLCPLCAGCHYVLCVQVAGGTLTSLHSLLGSRLGR